MMSKSLGALAPHRRRRGTTFASALGLMALAAGGCGGGGGGSQPQGMVPFSSNPDGGGHIGAPAVADGGRKDAPAAQQPPVGAGMAVAKFCNGLRKQSGPIEFALEIGSPPVRFVAGSGVCAPPAGQPCSMIQAGAGVPVTLYLDGELLGQSAFDIPAGQDIVFEPELVMRPGMPTGLQLVGSLYESGTCPEIDLVDVGSDGGAPAGDGGAPSPPKR